MSHTHSPSQPSFFDVEHQLDKIHAITDFLVRLNTLINWSIFLAPLSTLRPQRDPSRGGRPPFDSLLMLKILILKTLYNLSDENTELLIRDRLSFREFLGLSLSDTVPDARTIWLFAELLKEQDMERNLFDLFHEELARHGLEAKGGCRMDGTFIEVPKQHNSRDENAQIKRGSIPERFTSEPHVGCHKDTDARWAKKNEEKHFGYKNHVLADSENKTILDYEVTDASVHDSIPCLDLMPPESAYKGQEFHADAAYVGSEHNPIQEDLKERGFDPQICEKGVRNHPLTPLQRFCNNIKSRVRCRIEHLFGAQKKRMGDETLRTIGLKRARFWIGMRNLVNNMCRVVSLK
jgi:IS5 family transposase